MTWWVLTYLDNYRPPHALSVLARTNRPDHLFMSWSHYKPSRTQVYRRVRGTTIWCGYKYTWDTPHVVEQNEPSDTLTHTLGLIPLQPADHVWYYLWSIAGAYDQPCQGPLVHVPPPEVPMPTARIYHSIDQPAVPGVSTIVQFDSVLWDDYAFYDPAAPDRLTIPLGALYSLGASVGLGTVAAAKCSIEITLNGPVPVERHSHPIEATGWAGAQMSLHTIMALSPGDFLQVRVYYTPPGIRVIRAAPNWSPHFWIAQIGAYPITPP